MKIISLTRLSGAFLPAFLFVGTCLYLYDAFRRPIFEYGVPSTGFLPLVLSLIMFACLAILAYQSYVRRADPPENAESVEAGGKRPAATAVCTLAYIVIFGFVGYTISTLLFSYALLLIFGYGESGTLKGQGKRIAASILITAAMYVFFSVLFEIRLPTLIGML